MNTTSHQPTAQTITKRTHPTNKGWLYLTITLKKAELLTQDKAEDIVCMGRRSTHDIALCTQKGKTLKGVIRRKDWKPEAK
jgi:hypothetical protein